MNVWDDDLEVFVDRAPFGSRRKRLVDPATARLGASVWEIAPHSTQLAYHFHHLQEELVVVLRGDAFIPAERVAQYVETRFSSLSDLQGKARSPAPGRRPQVMLPIEPGSV